LHCPSCNKYLALDRETSWYPNIWGVLVAVFVIPVLFLFGVSRWLSIGVGIAIVIFLAVGE